MENPSTLLVRARPDHGFSWIVLIIAFVICFLLDGLTVSFANTMMSIIGPSITMEMSTNLGTVRTTFMFLAGPLAATLVEYFSTSQVIMSAAIIKTFVFIITAIIPNFWFMIFVYGIIGGISDVCLFTATMILVVEYFDKRLGLATGLALAGSGVGAFAFVHRLGELTKSVGWRWALIIDAAFMSIVIILGYLLWQRKIKQPNEIGSRKQLPVSKSDALGAIIRDAYALDIARHSLGLSLMLASNFFLFVGMFTPIIHFQSMNEDYLISLDHALAIIGISFTVDVFMRIIYGFLSDARCLTAVKLNSVALLFATLGLAFYFLLANKVGSQAIFAIIFTIGTAGINCLAMIYSVYLVGVRDSGRAYGVIMMCRGFGFIIGLVISSIIIKATGSTSVWIWISTFLFLIGLALSTIVSFLPEFKHCLGIGNDEERGGVQAEPLHDPPSMTDPIESAHNDDIQIERSRDGNQAILS